MVTYPSRKIVALKLTTYFLVLYLTLGALFPGMDYGQISRVFTLIEHYGEHRDNLENASQTSSFWSYYKMHLLEDLNHEHPDNQDHQKLPFQQLSSLSSFYTIPFSGLITMIWDSPQLSNFHFFNLTGLLFHHTLLQPPIRRFL